MPDGEIFTAPVENSVEGRIYFEFPAIAGGREVSGIRLVFRKGRVVEASAEKNGEYLKEMLAADKISGYRQYLKVYSNKAKSGMTATEIDAVRQRAIDSSKEYQK